MDKSTWKWVIAGVVIVALWYYVKRNGFPGMTATSSSPEAIPAPVA